MSERSEALRTALGALERRSDPNKGRNATSADRIHALLKQAIAELVFKPHDSLSEKEIAAVLGVSKTPVREALIRLEAENLVQTRPRSGTYVAPIVPDDLFEAMLIREALEGAAVRLAARKADRRGKLMLRETMRRQAEAIEHHDVVGFQDADDNLHREIVFISGLPQLWALLDPVRVSLNRVRHLAAPEPGRIAMLASQHQAIVDALVANEPDAAVAAMQVHLDALYPFVESLLARSPELFADATGDAGARRRWVEPGSVPGRLPSRSPRSHRDKAAR